MPTAVAVSVANAVVDMIADASLSQEVTPVFSWADWELELGTDCGLLVDVIVATTEQKDELIARGKRKLTIPILIAVRKKLGTDARNDDTGRIDPDKVNPLVLLVQEISGLFMPERLDGFTAAVWDQQAGGTKVLANPHWDHLHKLGQFTGIVKIFFRVDVATG